MPSWILLMSISFSRAIRIQMMRCGVDFRAFSWHQDFLNDFVVYVLLQPFFRTFAFFFFRMG